MSTGEAELADGEGEVSEAEAGDDAVFRAVVEQLRSPPQASGKAAPMLLMSLVAFVAVGVAGNERAAYGCDYSFSLSWGLT